METATTEIMAKDCGDIAVYPIEEGTGLTVKICGDTIWLTQKQMAMLFGCNRENIRQHLKNIFSDGELDEKVVCKDFLETTQHGAMGGKMQTHSVVHYNLDAIISVGFRVNSKRGIAFRQWANKVLRDRMMAQLTPKYAPVPAAPAKVKAAAFPKPLTKAKCAATCMKCLFGRMVESAKKGTVCECHVARPTASGFPTVRPDDFCPLHVSVRSRKRTYAGLVPEMPMPVAVAVQHDPSNLSN